MGYRSYFFRAIVIGVKLHLAETADIRPRYSVFAISVNVISDFDENYLCSYINHYSNYNNLINVFA